LLAKSLYSMSKLAIDLSSYYMRFTLLLRVIVCALEISCTSHSCLKAWVSCRLLRVMASSTS